MEKHILSLLNTNLRVIIPDFGAFIIRQKEPLLLVFNEFLRYNDGLLIDYVARTENIDKDMARHQVSEYTENMTREIEAGKVVRIAGIGTLHKSAADKIEFVQEGRDTARKSAKKEAAKKTRAEDDIAAETIEFIDDKTIPEKKPLVTKSDKPREKSNSESAANKSSKKTTPEIRQPDVQNLGGKKMTPEPVKAAHVESTASQEKKPVPVPGIEQRPVESIRIPVTDQHEVKVRRLDRQQLIWIILVLVVLALVNAWFLFNKNIRGFLGSGKSAHLVVDTLGKMAEPDTLFGLNESDSFNVEKEAIADDYDSGIKIAEEPVTDLQQPVSTVVAKKFYIVAGCFRDEINADEMVTELNRQGYKAEQFGTVGNLFAVSYASFTDKESAMKELAKIRQEVAPEAWMVYY